eukprot:scaffold16.g36.t1
MTGQLATLLASTRLARQPPVQSAGLRPLAPLPRRARGPRTARAVAVLRPPGPGELLPAFRRGAVQLLALGAWGVGLGGAALALHDLLAGPGLAAQLAQPANVSEAELAALVALEAVRLLVCLSVFGRVQQLDDLIADSLGTSPGILHQRLAARLRALEQQCKAAPLPPAAWAAGPAASAVGAVSAGRRGPGRQAARSQKQKDKAALRRMTGHVDAVARLERLLRLPAPEHLKQHHPAFVAHVEAMRDRAEAALQLPAAVELEGVATAERAPMLRLAREEAAAAGRAAPQEGRAEAPSWATAPVGGRRAAAGAGTGQVAGLTGMDLDSDSEGLGWEWNVRGPPD